MPDKKHAEANAKAWYETICEHVAALECDRERLEELRDERDDFELDEDENAAPDGPGYANAAEAWAAENPEDAEELADLEKECQVEGEEMNEEDVRQIIQESPLSVEVRGDWHAPGATDDSPAFAAILRRIIPPKPEYKTCSKNS